jgi:hypothetical protein
MQRAVSNLNPICAEYYPDRTTPCTHHIHNESRYLYWPQEKECCLKCNSPGCGLLLPTWPTAVPHYYSGRRAINGVDCHTYFLQSGTPDRVATSTGNFPKGYPKGRVCELYDGGASFTGDNPFNWAIIPDSYKDTVDAADIKLPEVCMGAKRCER